MPSPISSACGRSPPAQGPQQERAEEQRELTEGEEQPDAGIGGGRRHGEVERHAAVAAHHPGCRSKRNSAARDLSRLRKSRLGNGLFDLSSDGEVLVTDVAGGDKQID